MNAWDLRPHGTREGLPRRVVSAGAAGETALAETGPPLSGFSRYIFKEFAHDVTAFPHSFEH